MPSAASVTAALLGIPECERAVVQVCFAYASIEQSAAAWASGAGAGPFFRLGDGPMELAAVSHRGAAAGWSHSTCDWTMRPGDDRTDRAVLGMARKLGGADLGVGTIRPPSCGLAR